MDTEIQGQLERITADLQSIQQQLHRIGGTTTENNRVGRDTNQRVRAIAEDTVWAGLIQDAILCGVCLGAVLTAVGYRFVTTKAAAALQQFCDTMPLVECNITMDRSTHDQKIQAFLDVMAWAEGTGDNYDIIVGGDRFTDYSDHPRQARRAFGVISTAAGRYQFIDETWDTYATKLGLDDFSPANQDKAAIAILEELGVPERLKQGDIYGAFCVAGPVWASFPCNTYGQNPKEADELEQRYRKRLRELERSSVDGVFPVAGVTYAENEAKYPAGNHDFGPRSFQGRPDHHFGYDVACAIGQPWLATVAGTIHHYDGDPNGWGPGAFWIKTASGEIHIYAHGDRLTPSGQQVQPGDVVGRCNSHGRSTGPHLHYEIRPNGLDSKPVDPEPFLREFKHER
ncbi:MAG: peptidoglycan DD-metalloendopeptidase family protein [Cyanothece sp. SIO2G6]|nr:peptidoglycan DD-metalloendopeptidase family protein [Cyanothece sp. SIO2G6]